MGRKGARGGQSEVDAIDSFLRVNGLWRKQVAKDGSCLFRAVSEQVFHTQAKHKQVRRSCIEYMRRNAEQFEPFIEGPFDHYLAQLVNPKEWGGHVEMTALADIYQRDFIVYQVDKGHQNVTSKGYERKIELCFTGGNHYDCVYAQSFRSGAAECQAIVYTALNSIYKHIRDFSTEKKEDRRDSRKPKEKDKDTTFWSKLLDPVQYVNVELEVWRGECQAQQRSDMNVATDMQYQVGDFCEAKIGGGNAPYRKVTIVDMNPLVVSDVTTKEEYTLQLQSIRPMTPLNFQNLSGYYQRPPLDYQEVSGRKQRSQRRSSRGSQSQKRLGKPAGSESASSRQEGSARPSKVATTSLPEFPALTSNSVASLTTPSKTYAQMAARTTAETVVPVPVPVHSVEDLPKNAKDSPVENSSNDENSLQDVPEVSGMVTPPAKSKEASPPFTFGDFSPVKNREAEADESSSPEEEAEKETEEEEEEEEEEEVEEEENLEAASDEPEPNNTDGSPKMVQSPPFANFPRQRCLPPTPPRVQVDFLSLPFLADAEGKDLPEDPQLVQYIYNVGLQCLKNIGYQHAVAARQHHQLQLWHAAQRASHMRPEEPESSPPEKDNEAEELSSSVVKKLNDQARNKAAKAFQAEGKTKMPKKVKIAQQQVEQQQKREEQNQREQLQQQQQDNTSTRADSAAPKFLPSMQTAPKPAFPPAFVPNATPVVSVGSIQGPLVNASKPLMSQLPPSQATTFGSLSSLSATVTPSSRQQRPSYQPSSQGLSHPQHHQQEMPHQRSRPPLSASLQSQPERQHSQIAEFRMPYQYQNAVPLEQHHPMPGNSVGRAFQAYHPEQRFPPPVPMRYQPPVVPSNPSVARRHARQQPSVNSSQEEVFYNPQHRNFIRKSGDQLSTIKTSKQNSSYYVPAGAEFWYQPGDR